MLPPRPANTALGAPCAASTGRNRETPGPPNEPDVFLVWAPRRCSRPTGPPTARRIQRALVPCLAPPVVPNCVHRGAGPPRTRDHRPSSASPPVPIDPRQFSHIPAPFPLHSGPVFLLFYKPCRDTINSHLAWSFGSSLPCLGVRLFCAQCMRLVESHSRWPCNSFKPHPAYP